MPSPSESAARIIVIMGVSGCGKSTVGALISKRDGSPFLDADDYHPYANVEKMRAGIPLTDEDRWPWLRTFGSALHDTASRHGQVVGACSALKRSYRDALRRAAAESIFFIHLDGPKDVIAERMAARADHYMPTGLLDSQITTLEPLDADEFAVRIDLNQTLDAILDECSAAMASSAG